MAITLTGLRARVEATQKPKIIRCITKPMIGRLKVQYAAYPTKITGPERDKIYTWMLATLQSPTLSGSPFPSPAHKIILYVDGKPSLLTQGSWQQDHGTGIGTIYLAGPSTLITPLERVAILATVARLTEIQQEPAIQEAVSTALVKGIKACVQPTWDGLVVATERPARMAFNLTTYEVAAEMQGKWFTPAGQPIKVDKTWTVMDF